MTTITSVSYVMLLVVNGITLVIAIFLFAQVLSARRYERTPAYASLAKAATPNVVIVPAHNEASVISATLQSILRQLDENDYLLVIADNCTDHTAQIARDVGAYVLERATTNKRGKGHALAYGVGHVVHQGWLRRDSVAVFIDADCIVHDNSLSTLIATCQKSRLPQQALYLMTSPPANLTLKIRITEFAWRLKNQLRPMGMARWKMGCQAMGTGMAIPWELVKQLTLASDDIVEDMRMGIDLQLLGSPMQYCPSAKVTSEFPVQETTHRQQRQRWEHGHLSTLLKNVPNLIRHSIKHKSMQTFLFALDLAIPPLTFFAIWIATIAGLNLSAWIAFDISLPILLSSITTGLFLAAIVIAWWACARDILMARELISLPTLLVSKLPIYWRFFTRREKKWVKTDRD